VRAVSRYGRRSFSADRVDGFAGAPTLNPPSRLGPPSLQKELGGYSLFQLPLLEMFLPAGIDPFVAADPAQATSLRKVRLPFLETFLGTSTSPLVMIYSRTGDSLACFRPPGVRAIESLAMAVLGEPAKRSRPP